MKIKFFLLKRRILNEQVSLIIANDAKITGYSIPDFLPFINKGKRKIKKFFLYLLKRAKNLKENI